MAQLTVCRLRRASDSAWPPTVDERLRDGALEELLAVPGFRAGWVGRNDPTAGNERVIATVWDDADPPPFGDFVGQLPGLDRAALQSMEQRIARVTIDVSFIREAPPTILRVYLGRTFPDNLELYFKESRNGVIADGADPMGPLVVVSGAEARDEFLTISTWSSWSCIETCTGGDIRRPLVTRNAARIAAGGPVHYEILAEVTARLGTPDDKTAVGASPGASPGAEPDAGLQDTETARGPCTLTIAVVACESLPDP